MKLLEMKTMFKMKNKLELINTRLAITEEKTREFGEIAIKTIKNETWTAKRLKKQIEQRISELCDNFQQPNICVIVISEAGKRDGDGGRRYIWRNNDCISSKFDRNYKPTDPRRSTNPKFQKHDKSNTSARHSQIL